MVKYTDTGTVWMWENRIAGLASLEKFPCSGLSKGEDGSEERAKELQAVVKLASSKRNVTANRATLSGAAQAQVGTSSTEDRRDEMKRGRVDDLEPFP